MIINLKARIFQVCLAIFVVLITIQCKPSNQPKESSDFTTAKENKISVEIIDSKAKQFISENADIETIARGFTWSEGTLWLKDQQALLFSDVPENKIYKWSEKEGLSVWLTPSGYTGPIEKKREGSNGLLLNGNNHLVICQHGDRRISIMDAPLEAPTPKFLTVANQWRNMRLNSPNDAVFHNDYLYFTDPPYGLPEQDKDPEKEIGFCGVFRVGKSGVVIMVIDSLTKPNGIGFAPGSDIMYVSNSDPKKAIWTKYTPDEQGHLKAKIIYDATSEVEKANGLPDGLKVNPAGYVFATGPGGIWIFSPEDELVARIHIPQATANCAFDDTFSHLYIAADSTIIRVALKNKMPAKE